MKKSNRPSYTQGMEDVERVMSHLDNEHKKARREEWLREHYSKQGKFPKPKEKKDESNSQP